RGVLDMPWPGRSYAPDLPRRVARHAMVSRLSPRAGKISATRRPYLRHALGSAVRPDRARQRAETDLSRSRRPPSDDVLDVPPLGVMDRSRTHVDPPLFA